MVRVNIPESPRCPVCAEDVAGWDPQCDACWEVFHRACGAVNTVFGGKIAFCSNCMNKERQ